MDPNANLAELRELVERFNTVSQTEEPFDEDDAFRMGELFEALDGWLVAGGFLPTAWNRTADRLLKGPP